MQPAVVIYPDSMIWPMVPPTLAAGWWAGFIAARISRRRESAPTSS